MTTFKCQTVWIETRPAVFVSKVQAYLSLSCSRMWNTKISFLAAFSTTGSIWCWTLRMYTQHIHHMSCKHYYHISLVSDHVSKTSNSQTHKYLVLLLLPPLSTIKYISDIFEDIGTVVVEFYIVVCIFLILLNLLVWYQSTIIPVILDRGRRFLDIFKTLRPAHFHAFYSHDHSRSIKTNMRQSCTLYLQFYSVYFWKHRKAIKDMYISATIYCRTRFMKMLKDLSGTYFVNIAVPNH